MPQGPTKIFDNIRSDSLAHLRTSIEHFQRLNLDLGLVAQFSLVIDTNIVIKELLWLSRSRRDPNAKSGLVEVVDANTVKLFGPPALFEEVLEKIPVVSAELAVDAQVMFEHWYEFKKFIQLEVPDPSLTQELQSGIDPDDAPFVALQRTIDAAGILSKDPHITAMGGHRVSLDCIFYLRDYSRNSAIEMSIKVAGTSLLIAGVASIGAACRAARSLSAAYVRLPDWVKLTLVVGGLLALSNPKARTATVNLVQRLAKGISEASPKAIGLISDVACSAYENQSRAQLNLKRALTELTQENQL
jgi:predicted nucleic acid-binding protein